MNAKTVTVRLVPQCECGYLFHQIELLYYGEPKRPQFSPFQCPSCGKSIGCIEAPNASPFLGLTAIRREESSVNQLGEVFYTEQKNIDLIGE